MATDDNLIPDANGDTPEQRERELQEKIAAYKKAYEQEFEAAQAIADEDGGEALYEKTRTEVRKLGPDAVISMAYLVNHAEKETVKFAASRYVIDVCLAKDPAADAGDIPSDPITQLMERMNALDKERGEDSTVDSE